MKNTNLILPGFHLSTLRKKPQTTAQKLAQALDKIKKHSISQLGECFNQFIPSQYLKTSQKGKFSRLRLFSKSNTFWTFFSQVLDVDGGCKEAIKKLQSHMVGKLKKIPSSSSSAYCQARSNMDFESLDKIFNHTTQLTNKAEKWKSHRVVVVDGTGLSMPDTPANQELYPQQKTQKVGCGFPSARALACFCLFTGTLLSYRLGNKKSHELLLLRDQLKTFNVGDILLADKMFCTFYDIYKLQQSQVDSVITLAKRKPKTAKTALKVLGKDDLLVQWDKPVYTKFTRYSKQDYDKLPEKFTLRQIKVTVKNEGFRVTSFYIITTLLDAQKYTAKEIADLYYQRWDVELFFRDIKTTMGMDVLRCKTPAMVHKEIIMHFIAYNCIRNLMVEAAKQSKVKPRLISFKATLQALRNWQTIINLTGNNVHEIRRLRQTLIDTISKSVLYQQLGRSEPRCLKRRPKPYQLMTQKRSIMRELPHRGKKRAKQA